MGLARRWGVAMALIEDFNPVYEGLNELFVTSANDATLHR